MNQSLAPAGLKGHRPGHRKKRYLVIQDRDEEPELIRPYLSPRNPVMVLADQASGSMQPNQVDSPVKPALLQEMEKQQIVAALGRKNWIQARAAR